MATTRSIANPIRQRNPSRAAMPEEKRLVQTAVVCRSGQIMYAKSDGLIYPCAANSVAMHYLAVEDILTAIGNSTTYKPVVRTHQDDVYLMNCYHGTAASAVITEANVGLRYALHVADTYICVVDISDTDNDAFQVVAPYWRESAYDDDSTDIYGRVLVKILESVVNAEPGA